MSNLLSVVDVALSVIESTDKIVRDGLSVSFWVIGQIVSALTSRAASRIYVSIIGVIIYACQSAIESGRIVGEGYHSVDVVDVVPSEPTQRLLCGSKTPLLLAPAVEVDESEFIDSLLSIAAPHVPNFDSVSLPRLRLLGSLYSLKGASRWTRSTALDCLATV